MPGKAEKIEAMPTAKETAPPGRPMTCCSTSRESSWMCATG